jgi:hypothetical protein
MKFPSQHKNTDEFLKPGADRKPSPEMGLLNQVPPQWALGVYMSDSWKHIARNLHMPLDHSGCGYSSKGNMQKNAIIVPSD